MGDVNERAKFSISDGRIEIEGSESFVAAQLAKLEPLLVRMFEERALSSPECAFVSSPNKGMPLPSSSDSANERNGSGGLDDYRNVFKSVDDRVAILQSLPGKSVAMQAQGAALLLAFANQLIGKATTMDEIKAVCQKHSCFDSTNFSKIFKTTAGKKYFTVNNSSEVELTFPGSVAAKTLADSLNQ